MQYITDTYPPETIKRMEVMDKRCRQAAREYFTKRCEYYRQFTGGSYTRVTIRDQKTRWGSCSSRGTLSFNYRLIFAPPVMIHMNHSRYFWNLVGFVMPEYKIHRAWLKEHGRELNIEYHMKRLNLL